MNEDALLNLLRRELPIHAPSVIIGSGDDCAVVKPPAKGHALVLKTDATLEGIHFTKEADLADVGWKALCRPISDFAAMGAIAEHALVTVAPPASWDEPQWSQLSAGIGKAARTFGITIVGGEITRSLETLFLSVTLVGHTGPHTTLRSGALPGDLLCVTGKLGGSLQSGRHLTFLPRLAEGQWLAAQGGVHAMMDLSDGLGSDLTRLARASQCSFELKIDQIPCHEGCTPQAAISDGEDYELLLAIAPEEWPALHKKWDQHFPSLSLTPIGALQAPEHSSTPLPPGYDHFSKSDAISPSRARDPG